MRTKTIFFSERNLIFVIAGQLFDQAPNRQPRKAEAIMQKVKETFRKDAHNDNEFYSIEIAENDVYKYLQTLLMGIPEFVELNLSQIEFDEKISVDDENRPKYSFTSRYDKYDSESWKSDFIDLDAFIRNVYNRLLNIMEMEQDCFCCKHSGNASGIQTKNPDKEPCNTCLVNSKLQYNFEETRKPKGEYTFACKFNCSEHKYICCEECKRKENCSNKCDGNSDTCGNKVMD